MDLNKFKDQDFRVISIPKTHEGFDRNKAVMEVERSLQELARAAGKNLLIEVQQKFETTLVIWAMTERAEKTELFPDNASALDFTKPGSLRVLARYSEAMGEFFDSLDFEGRIEVSYISPYAFYRWNPYN